MIKTRNSDMILFLEAMPLGLAKCNNIYECESTRSTNNYGKLPAQKSTCSNFLATIMMFDFFMHHKNDVLLPEQAQVKALRVEVSMSRAVRTVQVPKKRTTLTDNDITREFWISL